MKKTLSLASRSLSEQSESKCNGMEREDEISGLGNSYHYLERDFDVRTLRWKSIDGKDYLYPQYSPYSFVGLNPILHKEKDGDIWDTFLDAAFIAWDISALAVDFITTGTVDPVTVMSLSADVTCLLTPFATGGGLAVRLTKRGSSIVTTTAHGVEELIYVTFAAQKEFSRIIAKKGAKEIFETATEQGGKFVVYNRVSEKNRFWYRYQEFINGLSGSAEYKKIFNGKAVHFDGYVNGKLVEAKGKFQWMKNLGDWAYNKAIKKMIPQFVKEQEAADGAELVWHFAEEKTMLDFKKALKEEGVKISPTTEIKYTPMGSLKE